MASNNYSLKYRTFDQLFEDVTVDLKNYALEGMIDPQTLIKVARRVNYDLGFRIYRTRQIILEVEHHKVRLPDDFHILNYALVTGEYRQTEQLPQGTHVEEQYINPPYVPYPETPSLCEPPPPPCTVPTSCCDAPDPCNGTYLTPCGDEYKLVQKIKTYTRVYESTYKLYIDNSDKIDKDCPNRLWNTAYNRAEIKNGFLKTNFESGKVYLNYLGDMIDDDGNLLVPDHELLNDYYEYALKERILENLMMNDENVANKYQLISQKLRFARNNALSLVNTPDFSEMQKLWQVNRRAQYHNYYDMFKSN